MIPIFAVISSIFSHTVNSRLGEVTFIFLVFHLQKMEALLNSIGVETAQLKVLYVFSQNVQNLMPIWKLDGIQLDKKFLLKTMLIKIIYHIQFFKEAVNNASFVVPFLFIMVFRC